MWRWLIAAMLAGCVYHPQKLTSAGDTAGDDRAGGDSVRLDTWTDLGNSSVGPRDAPLPSSASGPGVSASTEGAYFPDVAASDTAIAVAWQDTVAGVATVRVLRFANNVWSSFDGSVDGHVANGKRPSLAFESDGTPVVAYEANNSIAVVRQSGSTWTPYGDSTLITDVSGEPASQPSLAIGPIGAVVAYRTGVASATASDSVRVRRHYNGWTNMPGASLQVFLSEGGNNPDLALMPTGEPVVVWDGDDGNGARDVYLRKLEGSIWQTVGGTTTLNAGGSATKPAIAINPDGHIAVAWLNTTPGVDAVYLEIFDGTWHGIQGSTTGYGVSTVGQTPVPAYAPDVAFPGPENFEDPIVTYSSHGNVQAIHVRMPARDGVDWVGPTHPFYPSDGTISWRGHDGSTPAVALIPTTGRPVVAWSNEAGGPEPAQIFVKRYTCLTMWEAVVEGAETGVSDAATCAEAPSLAMNGNADPTVAWQTFTLGDDSNWEIHLRSWTGDGWSGVAGSDAGGGVSNTPTAWWDSGWPSLALGGNGKPWVAWAEFLPEPVEDRWTVYGRVLDGGWVELANSASGAGIPTEMNSAQFPSLAVDTNGHAWLAWNHDGGDVRLAHWNGSVWDVRWGPVADTTGQLGRTSLAIDSNGTPFLAWFRQDAAGDRTVYVHRYDGGGIWSAVGGSDGAVAGGSSRASSPSLAVGSDDRPVVAYKEINGNSWDIFVSRWESNSWQRLGSGGASTGAGESREPSLALDSVDQPVVAWAEATGTDFEIHARRFDGSRWVSIDGSTTGGGISNTNTDSRYPILEVVRDRACVAWTDAGPAGLQVAVRCVDLRTR